MALSPGTKLGPYEILAPLGAGGMGEVYRARDPRLKREVALKVVPAEVASEPQRLYRLELEAQSPAARNHPHIGPNSQFFHLSCQTRSHDHHWDRKYISIFSGPGGSGQSGPQ